MSPAKFIREVRQETARISWPGRKETMVSTAMVLILSAVASVFFLLVDLGVGSLVRWVLK